MSILLRQLPPAVRFEPSPVSFEPAAEGPAPRARRKDRDRIWDLSTNLHCSIVGTCLTTGELRQLLAKLGDTNTRTASSHAIHHRAVQAASLGDLAGKLLNKLLDRKHETFVRRFNKATTRDEVAGLWRAALEAGDIPGAYWATLTHPMTDDLLVREAFGEVHMLSHLVGTSNRLDLARLRRLEETLAEREDTIARQQARLQEKVAEIERRDHRIGELEALTKVLPTEPAKPAPDERNRLDLLRRADVAEERCARLETELAAAQAAQTRTERALSAAETREAELKRELAQLDEVLAGPGEEAEAIDFRGATFLYVGGRPGQVERLRDLIRTKGGELLTHDGGVENNHSLLPGLVARADAVFFPVDCVSHGAVNTAKRHCREMRKPFVPVRHASLASFLSAAIQHLEATH
ncbi:DUF2325 domain-containing protein [Aureimonas sp. AU20]|nr:DUF2325 domain-containing protein [Aureimonas sp. AU20]ALN75566.1 hypothetical protein M673_22750 [Aureimonas sp. AU20]